MTDLTFFIRTYAGDAAWLGYCLRSLKKNAPDTPIALVADEESVNAIKEVSDPLGVPCLSCVNHHVDGYVAQQLTKLSAYEYVKTKFVAYIDSDTILLVPPSTLFHEGKPIMLKTPWDMLSHDALVWREVTKSIVGFDPPFEYMRRFPLVYPTSVLLPFQHYIRGLKGPWLKWFPIIENRAFSEFNALGAYCDRFQSHMFHWIDTSKEAVPPPYCNQRWSWGGVTDTIRAEIEKELAS